MWLEILACSPLLVITYLLLQKDKEPLLGVYAQPGKWFHLKRVVFIVMMWMRKRKNKREPGSKDDGTGYGMKSHSSKSLMEKPQVLSKDPNALDAVYINGLDSHGNCFILRLGRRHNRETEIWLTVRIKDSGIFQFPDHPDTRVYNTNPNDWNAGGLKFECLEPMRRWKVTFNGLLRRGLHNTWTEDKGDLVHVKFSFIWDAFTDMFDFDTDLDTGAIADAIAREKWTKSFWKRLKSRHQTHYEQGGMLRGVFKVDQEEEKTLILRGIRDHSYGVRDWRSFHRYVVHFLVLENGSVVHVNTVSLPCTTSYLQCGYHSFPNAVMTPVQTTDINLPLLGENNNPPDKYDFNYTAAGKQFHCTVSATATANYYLHDDWGAIIHEKICEFTVNGVKGYGITEFIYRNKSGCPVPPQESITLLAEPTVEPSKEQSLTLPFNRAACCSARLVGGKGCQLAFLSQSSSKDMYIVPKGFCLTIAAFELQLSRNPELKDKVISLERACRNKSLGKVQSACKKVVDAFKSTPLHNDIQQVIAEDLIRIFHTEHAEKLFAVRSSAAGEDSAEMSAAGQMETILGVRGLQNIFQAVCQCWASHFDFPAVEYRRQHGQSIKSSMGVVIQEMVRAHCAGVLFTRDPLTGDPSKMVMNANYGLGESVVSGGSEPDNITISRSWDNTVTIKERIIGSKKVKINTLEGGGTREESTSSEDCKICCINDADILQLANIGIQLEKEFGDPRDIEFAVSDGKVFLLQARPITSLDSYTEWQLIHEFDSGIASDNELITTANIQEMMPGAVTPLTYSTFIRSIEKAGQAMYVKASVIPAHNDDIFKFMSVIGNSAFINLHFMMSMYEGKVASSNKKMAELAVLGETLDDFGVEELHDYHGVDPFFTRVKRGIKHWKNMYNAYKKAKTWEEKLKTYSIANCSHSSAEELYTHINRELPNYLQSWEDSLFNSAGSATWSNVLMAVIAQGKEQWTTDYYSDVAMMLSNCEDVYSADVPAALQQMTNIIKNGGNKDVLLSKTPLEAVKWLMSSESDLAGRKFAQFLKAHGHRCVREAEFRVKSWQTEPVKVIEVIQSMLRAPQAPGSSAKKSKLTVKEAIANVRSPTTFTGRQALKWILPKARAAVGTREWGKSLSIQMVEVFKLAYWKLAKMMVDEGRLPDEDLLFFFTHEEIGTLLAERSGKLVARAQKRRRILPKQNKLTYQRINRGIPKTVDEMPAEEDYVITSLKLKGMPVSCGAVKGTARVVTTLEEAGTIQQGEILIVNYTDVGWSPYFPLISGLVTEIGGLLSHGAVVAREYGLPCVVNMPRATSLFKSGDTVILNGTKGTLEKLEE